jgi:hypothetical protein
VLAERLMEGDNAGWQRASPLGHSRLIAVAGNKMLAFIKRYLMHYGIYRRYPRFPPCVMYSAPLNPDLSLSAGDRG